MAVYVGLDCGGTSCRALAIDESGSAIFRGQSGAANLLSTPRELVAEHVSKALAGCPDPTAVVGCFAGLLTDRERAFGCHLLRARFPNAGVEALPDFYAPLRLAEPCSALVIAGTGSIIVSRVSGKVVKSGGRGYLLGDRGSAFRIGQAAVAHFLAFRDTSLNAPIESWCGGTTESEITAFVYSSPSPAGSLARLAEPIGKLADSGDETCAGIIAAELAFLVEQVVEHSMNHKLEEPLDICLAGGLWKAAASYERIFGELLKHPNASAKVRRLKGAPVEGAALLAKEIAE